MNSDIEALMSAGKKAKLKPGSSEQNDWNGKVQIYNLDKINPKIRDFIENDRGLSLASYAKQALLEKLKKDGFEL